MLLLAKALIQARDGTDKQMFQEVNRYLRQARGILASTGGQRLSRQAYRLVLRRLARLRGGVRGFLWRWFG
jgi:hypothetical protein